MFTRRHLLAAALLAAPSLAPASVKPAAAAMPSGEVAITTEQLGKEGDKLVALPDAHGNPVLTSGGARIEAGRIEYDPVAKSAAATGGVKVDFSGLRLLTDGAEYRSKLRTLETGRVRFGMPPVYADADKIKVTGTAGDLAATASQKVNTASGAIERVRVFFNEPDAGVISLAADSVAYDSATDTLRVEKVVFRIGAVPVMYLPAYEQQGLDLPPLDPEIQLGANRRQGAFLRSTTFWTANKRWQPGLSLDTYWRAGVLAGPALRYDTAKVAPDEPAPENLMKGEIRTGFIYDESDRGVDQFNRPIDPDRHFIEWKHKQTIDDSVEVTNLLHWWSDPYATRDFRPKLYQGAQSPDNFLEIVVPDRAYYGSFFVRHDPNRDEDIATRLPEVRLDLNPRQIADTGITQRGHVAVAYLRETTSPELAALPGTTDDTLATPRVDAYYGLTRPLKPDSSFALTPVAGVRSTTWFDAQNGSDTYSRLAGQVGFDAQALATGKWDYENTIWEINGLRHKLRPVVQYRYLPGVTDGDNRIPRIDRRTFLTAPPPIDLQQRRDTDEIHETQILRVGLENLFQTRHVEYGSRDLVGYNLYQDFRDTDAPGERVLSDTYSQLRLTPAGWLDFTLYNRIDPYSGKVHETTTGTTFHDGDRWKLTLGTQRVTDVLLVDQYYLTWEYKITSRYTVLAHWRYDDETAELVDQSYGIRQQLGHSWEVEYAVGRRQNAREDGGTYVNLSLRLNTF